MPGAKPNHLYFIPILSKALDILELLEAEKRSFTLEDIFRDLPISKTSIYRIVKTLVHRGYVARLQDGCYRVVSRPKKLRFGFASQGNGVPFSESVTASLRRAASRSGIELIVMDNKDDPSIAIRNAREFVGKGVDLVIEFQAAENLAPSIAHTLSRAKIPLIAIELPHPHATYFGVDNFQVGFEAGELLAQHAIEKWKGKVDWIIGIDIASAGSFVQSRITGAIEGVRSLLPDIALDRFVVKECGGLRHRSYLATADFLRLHKKQRILVAAATDASALGALQAAVEAGRTHQVAIVGQEGIQEVLDQMRLHPGLLIGSVSHEADTYGPRLMQLGVALLRGGAVPAYNFVDHKLITSASLKAPKTVPEPPRTASLEAKTPTTSRGLNR